MLRPTDELGKQRNVSVRLLLDASLSRAVRERPNFFQTAEQLTASGLEVSLQVRDIRDVLPWVLSWGAGVTVYFIVPDVQKYHDQLLKRGAHLAEPLHDMPFGRTFSVNTPDGHRLGFYAA